MVERTIYIYNSLTGKKEAFKPIQPGHIGMYVCGPTVYSDVHLGNVRTFTSFDVIYRYLTYIGYKVRYIRNITDVGHLLDDGEDRMAKRAKLEKLEPMEVAQKYSNSFHVIMHTFNNLDPSIEPRATAHIIEQINMVQQILDNGYGYVENGSVYFDTMKFHEDTGMYGKLSGRIIEDLISESRDDLKNQSEKRHPSDFAIWMKASDNHIMKWESPWSVGFPGWHLECSAMSTKYLGKTFDIHGGGNDLKFPHHENEIAQNLGSCKASPANYWLHTNMLLMNGKKMSKSDGNTISPEELFTGDSPHISKAYAPMVVRFFMLQSHYRSTMDITDEALQAAEKGFKRLMEAIDHLQEFSSTGSSKEHEINAHLKDAIAAAMTDMDDDFNTPKAISRLFEVVPKINSLNDGKIDINHVHSEVLEQFKHDFVSFITDVLGLKNDLSTGDDNHLVNGLMDLIIEIRQEARAEKNWSTSDRIRDKMNELEINLKDGPEGTTWSLK